MYTDGSRTILYNQDQDRYDVGIFCNEDSCDCLQPSIADFDHFEATTVSCYDGGNGSNKRWSNTDLTDRCNSNSISSARNAGIIFAFVAIVIVLISYS